jgi:hypothetical protein
VSVTAHHFVDATADGARATVLVDAPSERALSWSGSGRPEASQRGEVVSVRIFIVALLCAGCAGSSTQPSQTPLGQPFELRSGASAILDGGLTITFDRVATDSRCPMNALCIWVGDALVLVTISHRAGGAVQRELHTHMSESEASYLAYSIKLLALAPYPRTDRQILPGDYVATLNVTKK